MKICFGNFTDKINQNPHNSSAFNQGVDAVNINPKKDELKLTGCNKISFKGKNKSDGDINISDKNALLWKLKFKNWGYKLNHSKAKDGKGSIDIKISSKISEESDNKNKNFNLLKYPGDLSIKLSGQDCQFYRPDPCEIPFDRIINPLKESCPDVKELSINTIITGGKCELEGNKLKFFDINAGGNVNVDGLTGYARDIKSQNGSISISSLMGIGNANAENSFIKGFFTKGETLTAGISIFLGGKTEVENATAGKAICLKDSVIADNANSDKILIKGGSSINNEINTNSLLIEDGASIKGNISKKDNDGKPLEIIINSANPDNNMNPGNKAEDKLDFKGNEGIIYIPNDTEFDKENKLLNYENVKVVKLSRYEIEKKAEEFKENIKSLMQEPEYRKSAYYYTKM